MTQTRQVHQVKFTQAELVVMFREKALTALASGDGTTSAGDLQNLANTNVNWRGTIDGGIAVLLDPVWPEA